ncbi:MAG: hypothetical protein MJY93_01635 [Fibrobacter sp.]|nr:hypothetical protein [Fibrobacter sp.]
MANDDLIGFASEMHFSADEFPESRAFFEKIKEYNDSQKVVKGKVTEILATISDFRNPAKSDVDSAIKSINKLQEQFSAVSSLAEEFGNVPKSADTSVKDMIRAVGEECKNGLKKQIACCKETLVRFINVKAMLEEYAVALSPFQDSAQNLLSQLQDSNEDTIKKSIGAAENNRLFLKLMDTDPDEHSDQDLDAIQNVFGQKVMRGLVRGKYADGPISSDATPEKEEQAPVVEEVKVEEETVAEPEVVEPAEAAEPVIEETAVEESEVAEPEVVEPAEAAEPVIEETVVESNEEVKVEEVKVEEETAAEEPAKVEAVKEESEEEPLEYDAPTARQLYELKNRKPTDKELVYVINKLITSGSKENTVLQATLLAKAASFEKGYSESQMLSAQLQLATHIFFDKNPDYSSLHITEAFPDNEQCSKQLLIATYIMALLTPPAQYDYALESGAEELLDIFDSFGPELSEFKTIISMLRDHLKDKHCGITQPALLALNSEEQKQVEFKNMKAEASGTLQKIRTAIPIKQLPEMYGKCFTNKDSLFYETMNLICNGMSDSESLNKMESFLNDYLDENSNIDKDKVSQVIDDTWREISGKKVTIKYNERNRVENHFYQRLNLIKKWVDHHKVDVNTKLIQLRAKLLDAISKLENDNRWQENNENRVLAYALCYLKNYLKADQKALSNINVYGELLQTGVISLDENDVPWIDERFATVKFYEPWRNILKHITSPKKDLDTVVKEISDKSFELFDNICLLEKIHKMKGEDFDVSLYEEAEKTYVHKTQKDFNASIVYAYTYGQINETAKESIESVKANFESSFKELGDYACLKSFLNALERQKDEIIRDQKKKIRLQLDQKFAKLDSILQSDVNMDEQTKDKLKKCLEIAQNSFENDGNFAVAEEYMNRFERRDLDFNDISGEDTYFEKFTEPGEFNDFYEICAKNDTKPLKNFSNDFIRNRLPEDIREIRRNDFENITKHWPSYGTAYDVSYVINGLGFDATKNEAKNKNQFSFKIKATPKNQRAYAHPIAEFGTNLHLMNVLCLTGKKMPVKKLVETINEDKDISKYTVVLYDGVLSLNDRRELAEHCHKENQLPFLLIDRVLILYLCTLDRSERIKALLQCTLPYTVYKPFTNGSGATTDEMFFGREKELTEILDLDGACFVYGGRQLGKTALLQRSCSRFTDEKRKAVAVYVNIQDCKTEDALVEKVSAEICERLTNSNATVKAIQEAKTLKDLANGISALFKKGAVMEMLLLLDEADGYLEHISSDEYLPIVALIELRRNTNNKFKFVFAGLHNVCRATNAKLKNGVFGQIGNPLCVKPLLPTDALHLILEPLRYLGFQVERYPYLETILANTNYYPGMIQYFGKILVQELLISNYRQYYKADSNPPFKLEDHALYTAIADQALIEKIKEMFRLSLVLDNKYYMLARLVTLLFHESQEKKTNRIGFSVDEIKHEAEEWEIFCLSKCEQTDYENLLSEMVDMGILDVVDKEYRMRRSVFIDYIGPNKNELFDELINTNDAEMKKAGVK